MPELSDAAYEVADQYRNGQWPRLRNKEWGHIWAFLLEELERRCPGYSVREYGIALDKGFVESRSGGSGRLGNGTAGRPRMSWPASSSWRHFRPPSSSRPGRRRLSPVTWRPSFCWPVCNIWPIHHPGLSGG